MAPAVSHTCLSQLADLVTKSSYLGVCDVSRVLGRHVIHKRVDLPGQVSTTNNVAESRRALGPPPCLGSYFLLHLKIPNNINFHYFLHDSLKSTHPKQKAVP